MRRDQTVFIARHDERRRANPGERVGRVEIDEGLKLQIRRVKRRGIGDFPQHLSLDPLATLFEIGGRIGDGRDAPRGLVRREADEPAHHRDDRRPGVDGPRPAGKRRAQNEPFDALGVAAGELLGHRATHRISKNMGARDFQVLEQVANVLRDVRKRIP